jgi:TonB-linked SusC/RagA family outer membrane protein
MTKTMQRLMLLLLLSTSVLFSMAQQKKTITGTVKDNAGVGLPGITVQVKGTQTYATTNGEGLFSITTNAASPVLLFTGVGFAPREISGSDKMDVTLETSANELGGVVVTSLGLKRQAKSLGYATTTVSAKELTKAGTPNFATALYGKAPGVRIAASPGGATSGVNINIRGVNSINGRSQPLVILDGIPIRDGDYRNNDYWSDQRLRGNGLIDLNPEDIETLTVLKGSSAAALYGSDAVNGVLLVTTKSGKGKKGFTVDFNATYGVDQIAYLPRYQSIRAAGAPKHVANAGQDDNGFLTVDTNGDGVPDTRSLTNFSINFGPKFDGQPILNWKGEVIPYNVQENGYEGLFQNGSTGNYNVSVSNSSDNANVRFSLTRQDNQGLSRNSSNVKNIANFNSSLRFSPKFTTDLMVNYINQVTKNRPFSVDRMINNFGGMMGRFDNADWYFDKYKTSRGYRYVTGANTQSLTPDENIKYNGFKDAIGDYVWNLLESRPTEYNDRVIASMTHTLEIVKGLKLRGRFGTDFTSETGKTESSTQRPLVFGNNPGGSFSMYNEKYTVLYTDLLLSYNRKINEDFEFNVMGGYTATKESLSRNTSSTSGGLNPENKFDLSASINQPTTGTSRMNLVKDALLATANLSYKGYLFVEGTVRRDRTSTLNPGSNSFVYPSVNTSFVLSEAVKLPEVITYAKVRASWGIVGNYTTPYAANIAYSQGSLGVQQSGGASVLYNLVPTGTFGNENLRPEEKHEFELGLEAKFFNNRLSLDMAYYNALIKDQILNLSLPISSGASAVLANVGELRNQGIEIALSGYPFRGRNFTWETGINYSYNKNVVEKLASGATELLHADYDGNAAVLKSVVGQPMGDLYAHPVAKNAKGEMIVAANGLHQLDPALVKVGNTMPKAIGGFFNNFNIYGVQIDLMIDYRIGGYVMPTGINWMISRGLLEESTKYMDEASGGLRYYLNAQGKGVQTTGTAGPNGEKVFYDGMLLPGALADGSANTNVISQALYYWNTYNWGGPQYSQSRYELYIKENNYVKLREASIGYSLPSAWAKKIKARNITLSVFGRNLFFLYRSLKDLDPEQLTAGSRWQQTINNAGTNPATRTLGVMLRTSF